MKYKDTKELIAKYLNSKVGIATYKAMGGIVYVIWEAVRSCFGSGVWKGDRPWLGKDAWKY